VTRRLAKSRAKQGALDERPTFPTLERALWSVWDLGTEDEQPSTDSERVTDFALTCSYFCKDADEALEGLLFAAALRTAVEKRDQGAVIEVLREQLAKAEGTIVHGEMRDSRHGEAS